MLLSLRVVLHPMSSQDEAPQQDPPAAPASKTATFTVGGMSCAACVSKVERALLRHPAIATAKVALLSETAEVTYDPAALRALAAKDLESHLPPPTQNDPEEVRELPEVVFMEFVHSVARIAVECLRSPDVHHKIRLGVDYMLEYSLSL